MEELLDRVHKATTIWISAIIVVVYGIMLACYQGRIERLQKPAGFIEALTFLFNDPSDYLSALLIGILLHIICLFVVAITVLYLIGVGILQFQITAAFIINIIMSIAMSILNACFAKYVMSLVLVVLFIGAIVWLLIASDK